jgi:hypothetical protein
MFNMCSKGLMVFSLMFSLTACAANLDTEKLADDPTHEDVVPGLPDDANDSQDKDIDESNISDTERAAILAKYNHLDPNKIVPSNALSSAVIYYDRNQSRIRNKKYMSVIDFSKSSKQSRFFIINMDSGAVWAIHVAHGKGSDSNHDGYADKFSNSSGSNASSLGYYLAAETYSGKHGLSLKLDGLSSTNSNARARAVVIHGASYVKEASVIQGRSWGCPAVTMSYRDKVIGLLKGGSLIYATK